MSIASEITRLQNAKASLKTSINAKTDSSHQIDDETLEDYADFVDSIQSGGGDLPEKGVVFSEWDEDGYPTKAEIIGITTIPANWFNSNSASNITIISKISNVKLNNVTTIGNNAFRYNLGLQDIPTSNVLTSIGGYAFGGSKIINCNIPNSVTSIGTYAFSGCVLLVNATLPNSLLTLPVSVFSDCSNLETVTFPTGLTTISDNAFQNCTKLNFTQFPNSLTSIGQRAFYNCVGLKKFSINGIATMNGSTANNSSFTNCTGLKQVWIGSPILNLLRYTFNGCTALEKIYIDKPRATVQNFAGYTYAFMNNTAKTGIIVCNDDAEFISKAEFDALVVE